MSTIPSRTVVFLTMDKEELAEKFPVSVHTDADSLLDERFAQVGWSVVRESWSDASIEWSSFAAVVIRTTWDYQYHLEEFLAALGRIESATKLANSVSLVRWNVDKRYLLELERKGIPIVPSVLVEPPLEPESLLRASETFQTRKIVVKPTIGASGSDSFLIHDVPKREQWPCGLLDTFAGKECLVQPFIPSIMTDGEFSVLFFGGKFSHVVCKQATVDGEYRIQEEFGGRITPLSVAEDSLLVQSAKNVLAAFPEVPLYARIDLIRSGEEFLLMEAECIEPALYIAQDIEDTAATLFVDEFLRWLQKS